MQIGLRPAVTGVPLHAPIALDNGTDPRVSPQTVTPLANVSAETQAAIIEVFKEIARVLKPGAPFALTFSDRWFPPKAIELWSELHPFERLGLVLQYFQHAGAYGDLGTESVQGLPRPEDDKYAGQILQSDPVFAVWGRRSAAD